MVRLTDRPDMTLDVYRGRKTTIQQPTFFTCLCKQVNALMKECASRPAYSDIVTYSLFHGDSSMGP